MEYVVGFIIGTLISWVTLMVVLPLSNKFADLALPDMKGLASRCAIVAGGVSLVAVALMPLGGVISWIASLVVFWVLMVKLFDVDLFAAIVISVVNMVLRAFLLLGVAMLR